MRTLVLAGGFDQIAFIKELQNRGCEIVLADYLENPPAKKYVKKHFCISTLDEDAIYHLALKERVDLIATACTDQALLTAAKVSEKLNLPFYLKSSVAQNITNKVFMKKIFEKYGIPMAKGFVLEDGGFNVEEIKNKLEFPIIVKPCDANSSKGVMKVNSDKELIKAVNNAFLISRNKKIIVEKFMEGQEISIDAWKDDEGAKILLVSETKKMRNNEGTFTIYQSRYPVMLSNVVKKKIQNIAEKICEAFQINHAPLLIQAVVYNDDVKVIECSARIGGGSKYKFIEHITNIDIMGLFVDRILGNTSKCSSFFLSDKYVEMDYIYAYKGIFEKLVGFEEKLATGEIGELFQYKQAGSMIQKRTTSSDRVIGFLIEAATCKELECKRHEILDDADILDQNGESILYRECFYEDGY